MIVMPPAANNPEAHETVAARSAPARFHDKVTWPLVISLVVAICSTVATLAFGAIPMIADGCDMTIQNAVSIGERRLNDGLLQDAADIGRQALQDAPDCRCAHLLLARTAMERVRQDILSGDRVKLRADRLECYAEARKAVGPMRSPTPQVRALLDGCSIASSAQTAQAP